MQVSCREVYRSNSLNELIPVKKQYAFCCSLLKKSELHLLSQCLIKTDLLFSRNNELENRSEVQKGVRQAGAKIRSFPCKTLTSDQWWDVLLYHLLGKKAPLLIGKRKHFSEGGYTKEFYPVMRDAWNAFMQAAPRPAFTSIALALNRACDIPSSQELVALIRKKEVPVIIPSGWDGHSITLVFFGSYLFLCNRGEKSTSFSAKNITAFRINTRRLDKSMVNNILSDKPENKEIQCRYLYKILPALLKAKKDEFCTLIETQYQPKDQSNQNCVTANLKLAIRVILYCQARLCNIAAMERIYQDFAQFSRLYLLQAYAKKFLQ